ncbi:MAG: FKBP-type peptidyl-prolyl cis-trans isomerase [Bacteroidota bacterium]
MKLFLKSMLLSVLFSSGAAAQSFQGTTESGASLSSLKDSVSYGLGVDIGLNLKRANLTEIDAELLKAGLMDVMSNENEVLLSQMDAQGVIQSFLLKKQNEKKLIETAFLEENKKKPGIITTPSGLQYEIIRQGSGPKPTEKDTVKTHYHGTLIDGTVFDSSVDRGEPISFPVGGVIKGWVEALQLMPLGSKYRLFIPSDLGYGDRGSPPKIGPGATLIFEVELLGINSLEYDPSSVKSSPSKKTGR